MKKVFATVIAAAMLWLGEVGISLAGNPVGIAPPQNLRIVGPSVHATPSVQTLPDFAIADVVKELVSADTQGTYYRYHVIVVNGGGSCRDCRVNVRADARFSYTDHGAILNSTVNMVTAPYGGHTLTTTFLINESERFTEDTPDLFLVTFIVDADDALAELDEANNTWTCGDVVMECDLCVGEACP